MPLRTVVRSIGAVAGICALAVASLSSASGHDDPSTQQPLATAEPRHDQTIRAELRDDRPKDN